MSDDAFHKKDKYCGKPKPIHLSSLYLNELIRQWTNDVSISKDWRTVTAYTFLPHRASSRSVKVNRKFTHWDKKWKNFARNFKPAKQKQWVKFFQVLRLCCQQQTVQHEMVLSNICLMITSTSWSSMKPHKPWRSVAGFLYFKPQGE